MATTTAPQLLSLAQAGKRLDLDRTVVWRRVKRGAIKAINVAEPGTRPAWRIAETDLAAYIASRTVVIPPVRRGRRAA